MKGDIPLTSYLFRECGAVVRRTPPVALVLMLSITVPDSATRIAFAEVDKRIPLALEINASGDHATKIIDLLQEILRHSCTFRIASPPTPVRLIVDAGDIEGGDFTRITKSILLGAAVGDWLVAKDRGYIRPFTYATDYVLKDKASKNAIALVVDLEIFVAQFEFKSELPSCPN